MKKFIYGSLVLAILGLSLRYFLRSSVFKIEEIRVVADSLPVKKIMEEELEVLRGQNMWAVDLPGITARVLDENKIVRSLNFQRHWPSVLFVRIEERKAVAMVFQGKDLWLIDSQGVPFEKTSLVKTGSTFPLYFPTPPDNKTFLITLAWLEGAQTKIVNGLAWEREMGLVAILSNQQKVIMGRENFFENWRKAKVAVDFLSTHGIHTKKIDATYNKRAVVSL